MTHWTERSVDDFLYRIAADFIAQLEAKIQSERWSNTKLAQNLGVSKGRVSQIRNNPGNLTLRMIIKCARALGMKIAIVAYDDKDHRNERGPINSEIFRICWENSGKPADFWSLTKSRCVATNTATLSRVSDTSMRFVYTRHASGTSQRWWGFDSEWECPGLVELANAATTAVSGQGSGGTLH